MAEWKDILYENDGPLSDEDLLKYLNKEKAKQLDKDPLDDFEKDALEGLQKVENADEVKQHVAQLKNNLKLELNKRKKKKLKRKITGMDWVLFAVILLLFVCIIGYGIIRMINK